MRFLQKSRNYKRYTYFLQLNSSKSHGKNLRTLYSAVSFIQTSSFRPIKSFVLEIMDLS